MVEQANAREEAATSTIERLQAELGQLTAVIHKTQALLGGDTTVEELVAIRDTLAIKLRTAEQSVIYERERAEGVSKDLASKNAKYVAKKGEIKELERQLASKAAEEIKEAKKKAVLEADLARLREQVGIKGNEIEANKKQMEELEESKAKLHRQIEAQRTQNAAAMNEINNLQQIRTKLHDEISIKDVQMTTLQETRTKLEKSIKALKDDLGRSTSENTKLSNKLDALEKEKVELTKKLAEQDTTITKLKSDFSNQEKDLNKEILHSKEIERNADRLGREKTAAEKKIAAEQKLVKDSQIEAEQLKNETHILENENRKVSMDMNKMRTVIGVLERERERSRQDIESLTKQIDDKDEELRVRDIQIKEMEKREEEVHQKLKAAQAMYEAMRTERNMTTKSLLETEEEVSELKRKSKVQGNQIDTLKEDIHGKDKALVAEQFETASLHKRLQQRAHEVDGLRKLLDDATMDVEKQANEIRNLNAALRRMDAEALAQKRAFDQVIEERDIISQQLTRRNDELALLHEKLSIMTTMAAKGEQQYSARLDDIRILKLKIADQMRQLNHLQDGRNTGVADLKTEVARMQRELMAEQSKCKALSDELQNPLNVHRWRKLEGTDPSAAETLSKLHTLQKRLIIKTEEVVEKEIALSKKDKELNELKAKLADVPASDIAEQLTTTQLALNERTRQLKAVASEITMAQAQVNEYKFEVEKVNKELFETKKQLYETRKLSRSTLNGGLSTSGSIQNMIDPNSTGGSRKGTATTPKPGTATGSITQADPLKTSSSSSGQRFVGGGFNIQA